MIQEFNTKNNNKEIGSQRNNRKINRNNKNLHKKNRIMLFKLNNLTECIFIYFRRGLLQDEFEQKKKDMIKEMTIQN